MGFGYDPLGPQAARGDPTHPEAVGPHRDAVLGETLGRGSRRADGGFCLPCVTTAIGGWIDSVLLLFFPFPLCAVLVKLIDGFSGADRVFVVFSHWKVKQNSKGDARNRFYKYKKSMFNALRDNKML